jgi:hypothetical protein
MNENISYSSNENTTNRVRFDENVVIIEFNAKERIYKKDNIINKLLKFIMRIYKNS